MSYKLRVRKLFRAHRRSQRKWDWEASYLHMIGYSSLDIYFTLGKRP